MLSGMATFEVKIHSKGSGDTPGRRIEVVALQATEQWGAEREFRQRVAQLPIGDFATLMTEDGKVLNVAEPHA
jgi:hypothetical protein